MTDTEISQPLTQLHSDSATYVNTSADVGTILVDGIMGLAAVGNDGSMVRFSFFEDCFTAPEGAVRRRFVANIAMSAENFSAITMFMAAQRELFLKDGIIK